MGKIDTPRIWTILESVADPEIPALSVVDMGIVRAVEWEGEELLVSITPTYSGCPAMALIEREIVKAFRTDGVTASVRRVISPAWTTEWLSEKGRQMLLESGIAPPEPVSARVEIVLPRKSACPFCGSENTEIVSEFGSTACKSLLRCRSCGSPFDYFKPL
jgi:ring-1,2-phenylacetyl-CoA epoxidase subunit PaaD